MEENKNVIVEEKEEVMQENAVEAAVLEEVEEETTEEKFDIKKEIISWIKVIISALVLAFILGNYVLMNAYIPTGSMESTLNVDDKLIGFRLAYVFGEPERYDVVMFKFPDDESKDYIKRIIGLPGETVTIKEGRVYINGSNVPLEEPYLKEEPLAIGDGTYEVPEGCYFMLGDNRNNSKDSRLWENKYVSKDKIMAKAIFRFYPDFSIIKTDY